MSPSEVLLAAADRLRDLAATATDAPWEVVAMRNHTFSAWSDGTGFSGEDEEVANSGAEGDARWIAALSPAVAEPLEAWLRQTADELRQYRTEWRHRVPLKRGVDDLTEAYFGNALDLARQVLGVGEEQQR